MRSRLQGYRAPIVTLCSVGLLLIVASLGLVMNIAGPGAGVSPLSWIGVILLGQVLLMLAYRYPESKGPLIASEVSFVLLALLSFMYVGLVVGTVFFAWVCLEILVIAETRSRLEAPDV